MKLAKAFPRGPLGVVIIHDPQPLAVLAFLDSVPESERPVVGQVVLAMPYPTCQHPWTTPGTDSGRT